MTKKIFISALMIVIMAALVSMYAAPNGVISMDLPAGWFKAGSDPGKYDMGVDKGSGPDGKNAATIKSIDKKISGFGTLMQDILPDNYLGKRIRMTGYMKSKSVTPWAGFWLRVDQKASRASLSFDNMEDRAIKGNTDWQKYEIVLDVPDNASNIAFGALLVGTGQIWFTKLNFEIVDKSVSTTGVSAPSEIPRQVQKEPSNLDFDK